MKIAIQTVQKGFYSASMNRISTKLIEVINEADDILGVISGDQLNEQLKTQGFEIVDYKNQNNDRHSS